MNRRNRRRGLTMQIFIWAVAAAMLGENNPFPTAFNDAMPVFAEMAKVVAEVAEIVPGAPTPIIVDCPRAIPSRISALGEEVEVLTNLHFRSSPEFISNNLVISHPAGTHLEIVGGPVCYPYEDGAFLWWQVENSNGEVGWSAEGDIQAEVYFMQPLEK
jgi:hypothetical protein